MLSAAKNVVHRRMTLQANEAVGPHLVLRSRARLWLWCFAMLGGGPVQAGTNFITQPLSLPDSVNIALRQNPGIRRAQKELEAVQGIVMQTRAIAIPKVRLAGFYSAAETSDVDIISTTNFSFGN